MPDTPTPTEADYATAARAFQNEDVRGGDAGHWSEDDDFRAAVDSAYTAGWRAGRIAAAMEIVAVEDAASGPDQHEAYWHARNIADEVPSALSRESNPASTERGTP